MKTKCPHCSSEFKAPDEYKNKKVKCPKCKKPFTVAEPVDLQQSLSSECLLDSEEKDVQPLLPQSEKIAYAVGSAFLLILLLSPFFNWITIFAGGMAGIQGDGKIIFIISLLLGIGAILSFILKKRLLAVVLFLQAWGTITCLWMIGMLWKIGNFMTLEDMEDNPFVGMFASQVNAGAGLYIGLIGGLGMAVAFGYFAIHFQKYKSSSNGRYWPFVLTQSVSIVVGIAVAILLAGPINTRREIDSTFDASDSISRSDNYSTKIQGDLVEVTKAKATEEKPKAIRDKQEYLQYIDLYGIQAKYYKTYLDEVVPGVNFKIKNNGDKTVSKVKVLVYFRDVSGTVIAEEDFYPISSSSFSTESNKLLKPNYIWQMPADKFYKAESVPDEWQEGNVAVKIVDIEFEEAKGQMPEKDLISNEKQDYIRYVQLYDTSAGYYDTYLDKRVPGVQFKIKNEGNRTLSKVKVVVYFKDNSGKVISEEDFYPVSSNSFSLESNKPLRPNYIWQMERGKFYKTESVPDEWEEGSIVAEITDIDFSE